MNIRRTNQVQNFGKKAVMTCEIGRQYSHDKKPSTLYAMSPRNINDEQEIKYSRHARNIYGDFIKDKLQNQSANEYYLLKDDETNEVIAAVMTSHHYRPDNVVSPGKTTLICELEDNIKYMNPAEPVMAYVINRANKRFDSSVSVGFYTEQPSMLEKLTFSKTENGDWIMPETRFVNFVDNAQKKYSINFIV